MGYALISVELISVAGENGESVGCYYTARLQLTVRDCMPITEEGVCPVQEGRNPRARIDAHDLARKGAITDALKRALRCYGEQFGLGLYDSETTNALSRATTTGTGRPVAPQRPSNPSSPSPAHAQSNQSVSSQSPQSAGQQRITTRPIVAQSSPATSAASAPRLMTTQPTTAPVQATAATNVELATEQQKQAIRRLASQRRMNEGDVENQLQRLYGTGINQLSKGNASDFIKRLNSSAA